MTPVILMKMQMLLRAIAAENCPPRLIADVRSTAICPAFRFVTRTTL
jgi:hypothetical protein